MGTTAAGPPESDTPFSPHELTSLAFPHPVASVEVRETNISWVVLTGSFAYKIKKSVRLGFIDTSTLARRHDLCDEELRLNRRLAKDLYLKVAAITREADGLRIDGHGQVVEYAVQMKQFDAAQELSVLLEHGKVSSPEFVDLAERLAQFHGCVPTAPVDYDFPHTRDLHEAVLRNSALLLSHLDADPLVPEITRLIAWTQDYLRDSLDQLRSRERRGAIRECHGDLHSRNVVRWCSQLVPFDCLEFDPKLRWIDVMNDIAFLVMDLRSQNRKDLAATFLNAYLDRTGDYDGVQHLAFYAVYRALVRAMVDSLGAQENGARRQELHSRLQSRVKAGSAYLDRPRPALFIMHGLSGSGKSWLSERLIPQLEALRIRSDVERKRVGGFAESIDSSDDFQQGLYRPEITCRTYARLLECAQSCLTGGFNTIVDAAFLKGKDRSLFRECALRGQWTFIIVVCRASHAVLVQRLEQRSQLHADPSDADVDILARQPQITEPLDEAELAHAITVDTTDPEACQEVFAAIQCRRNSDAG
jgi:hypothetical protein